MRKITIPDVLERFKAYHDINQTWGSLHNVLEDFNIKDDDVIWCIYHAADIGDHEGEALGKILLFMSKTQRIKMSWMV